jgi:hypothetical protein
MKRIITVLLCLLAFSVIADFSIVTPEKTSVQEKLAAAELSLHLQKATGEKVITCTERDRATGKKIYLGHTRFANQNKIDLKQFEPEEWLIKTCGDSLLITGGSLRGVLYGVMEFLDQELGILFLDETFTYIPNRKNYQWGKELFLRGKPAFRDRGIYSYFTNNPEPRIHFMLRNRLNMFCDERHHELMTAWQVSPVFGSPRFCHTFHEYTKDLGPEDEDCFSVNANGKRIRSQNASGPGQICYTNPKTRVVFLKKLRSYIAADQIKYKGKNFPDIYVIEPNDSPTRCVCSNCLQAAKRYGAYSGVMLEFLNELAVKIRKEYPEIILLSNAYMFTATPPKNIKPESNVIIRIAQLGCEWGAQGIRDTMRPLSHPFNKSAAKQISDWSRISRVAIWDYWILYSGKSNLPSLNTRAIAENMKFYKKQKVASVFAECESAHIASFHALRLWLGARFMNNPDLSFTAEVTRFIKAYYGPAAKTMQAYHDFLMKTLDNSGNRIGKTPVAMRTELDSKFFTNANKLLDHAEKTAGNDKELLKRIRRERISLDYGQLERSSYISAKDQVPREKLVQRFKENFLAGCTPVIMSKKGIAIRKKWLDNYLLGLKVQVPLPEQFKQKNVIADFTWQKISRLSRSAKLVNDPNAAGGKCIRISNKQKPGSIIRLGVYNPQKRRHLKNLKLKAISPDGKYHFYSSGTFQLTEECFVWAHWSWNIQANLSEFYDRSGVNNKVEAFVSMKISGAPQNTDCSIDRIILVQIP